MSELPPEYATRYVRNDDGSYSVWETHDGENWAEVELVTPPDDDSGPIKSETFFTEAGATTIDHWADGTVTAE